MARSNSSLNKFCLLLVRARNPRRNRRGHGLRRALRGSTGQFRLPMWLAGPGAPLTDILLLQARAVRPGEDTDFSRLQHTKELGESDSRILEVLDDFERRWRAAR